MITTSEMKITSKYDRKTTSLKSKTGLSLAKGHNYIWGGGGNNAQKKGILGGGTPHILC